MEYFQSYYDYTISRKPYRTRLLKGFGRQRAYRADAPVGLDLSLIDIVLMSLLSLPCPRFMAWGP